MINNNIEERSSKKEQVGRWFFNLFDWNIKKSPIFLILSKSFLVLILFALTSKLNWYLVGLLHFPTRFYGESRTVLVTQSRFLQWSEHEQSRIKGFWLVSVYDAFVLFCPQNKLKFESIKDDWLMDRSRWASLFHLCDIK